jgi:hypothetical protein
MERFEGIALPPTDRASDEHLDEPGELVFYCPDCAEPEFAST